MARIIRLLFTTAEEIFSKSSFWMQFTLVQSFWHSRHAMQGLMSLRSPEQVAAIRGKTVEEILG